MIQIKYIIFFSFSLFSICNSMNICSLLDVLKCQKITPNVDTNKVYLIHYIGTEKIKHVLTTAHTTIPDSPNFVKSLPMVIVTHGFLPKLPVKKADIAEAIEKTKTANVFYLDYYEYASNINYPKVVVDGMKIGEHLGNTLSLLKDCGVLSFHLIGHSLGAHLCGFAGKTYKKLKSSLIDRISGLDPAGPCFKNEGPDTRLDSSDAAFVDCILTDKQLGISRSIGHANFYVNGGDTGLLTDDHFTSAYFYHESVNNNNFLAVNCKDWDTFLSGACKNNPMIPMGYWTPTTTRNDLFLKTQKSSPYALGCNGIV